MEKTKRFLSSLPVILTLATIGALALMYILVDDPDDFGLVGNAAADLESEASVVPFARS